MELYLKISFLNDFEFCPLSIYYHQLYGNLSEKLYHSGAQINGKAVHAAIDEKHYSTSKHILQGVDIFCSQYQLCGKIDTFDIQKGILTERKKHIELIYDGYLFQLYAQYFGLCEAGYEVRTLRFYSFDTNKIFPVPLPQDNPEGLKKFEALIDRIQEFDPAQFTPTSLAKCQNCIYSPFCDRGLT